MPERPLRADARRNRERVVAAAAEVFGAGGDQASTEEVARRAGVGIGTVFRHFPTKAALLEAAFVARLDRLADDARARGDDADAGAAFFDFFAHVVHDAAAKLTLAGALADTGVDVRAAAREANDGFRAAFGTLLARAQAAGAVRVDVALPEVYAVLLGASRAAVHARLEDDVVTRSLEIVFTGLRPPRPG